MRIRLLSAACYCVLTVSLCQAVDKPDFRKAKWGMSASDVLAAEAQSGTSCSTPTAFDIEGRPGVTQVVCSVTIASLDTMLMYLFANDQLASAMYFFNKRYQVPNNALVDMKRWLGPLQRKYEKSYGKSYRRLIWTDELFESEVEKTFGYALSMGQLEIKYRWATDWTDIDLVAGGSNGETSLKILYHSAQLRPLFERLMQGEEEEEEEEGDVF